MSRAAVADAFDRAIARHGRPQSITVGHGTEFTSGLFTPAQCLDGQREAQERREQMSSGNRLEQERIARSRG